MANPNPGKPQTSVLIVEDDLILALSLRAELETLGYMVVGEAESGEDAVRLALQEKPDLILLDIRLGLGMDGIAAARAIKSRLASKIVFVTAHADALSGGDMRDVQPSGLLAKPYTTEQLAQAMRSALLA